jgi:hypothetical protein
MGNETTRLDIPLATVTPPLIGDTLLAQFKEALIQEPVFKTIFGNTGERIFVDKVPSYNDSIFPLLELYWKRERYENRDLVQSGEITGRILLPAKLQGDYNKQRLIAVAFQRFLGASQHNMFARVPGLTHFGSGMEFTYDQLLQFSGGVIPYIPFTIPFEFDLHLVRQLYPEVDFTAQLDAAVFGWVETYSLNVKSEEQVNLIGTGLLVDTGQEN